MNLLLRRASWTALVVDILLVAIAWAGAFWLRFNLAVPEEFSDMAQGTVLISAGSYFVALVALGVHRHVWRYTGLDELRRLALGVMLGAGITSLVILMLRAPNFPRSALLIHPLIALLFMVGVRALWRTVFERNGGHAVAGEPILIVGKLQDASEALRALRGSAQWRPAGILSPDRLEVGRSVQGTSVVGVIGDVVSASESTGATTALIASSAGSAERRELLLNTAGTDIGLFTFPKPDQWMRAPAQGPRRVEVEDLLGRAPVDLDVARMADMISGRTVLVTGAGGSIGSELCRQVAFFGVGRLVCVDVSEYSIYRLERDMRESHPQLAASYYTANVREADRLEAIFAQHRPALVLHAAAYKHVPLMEQGNEIEALRTNVLGTLNAANAAAKCGARRFVMVSTDKAVNPTNVMGASKRLAELVVQGVAAIQPGTQYVSVRFGNVLGSSGSVVPLFTAQIARGGPVTVTHPEVVRYFMTIPEAAQLVLQAGLMDASGRIFVLDMGEPVRIVDLARMLIQLSGHTDREVPITYIGLRPGEKLYEELLADDETTEPTPHPKLRIAKTAGPATDVDAICDWIRAAGASPDSEELRSWLRQVVPEYAPSPT